MRFSLLGSGSRGNAVLVEEGNSCVMVDCGFSAREAQRRLALLGKQIEDISAILVTHEHSDHIRGVDVLAKKHKTPLWMTQGTLDGASINEGLSVNVLEAGTPVEIGDLFIEPYTMPHDANEPCNYVFGNGDRRLGMVTDIGSETAQVRRYLSGCDALLLECNHDETMVNESEYPYFLKQRILDDYGHFSNEQAGNLLSNIDYSGLQHIVALHLSEKNNDEQLVRDVLSRVLGCENNWIGIAQQNTPLAWRELV